MNSTNDIDDDQYLFPDLDDGAFQNQITEKRPLNFKLYCIQNTKLINLDTTKKETYTISLKIGSTLNDLIEEIRTYLGSIHYILNEVPLKKDTYVLGIPRKLSKLTIESFTELNDSNFESFTFNTKHRFDPYFSITNLQSVEQNKKPKRSEKDLLRSGWLDFDDLKIACEERHIDVESDDDDLSLKQKLLPWHRGTRYHEDSYFEIPVAVYVSESKVTKGSSRKKNHPNKGITCSLLSASIYLDTALDVYTMDSINKINHALDSLTVDPSWDYDTFRSKVIEKYQEKYHNRRDFNNDSLFCQCPKSTKTFYILDNDATFNLRKNHDFSVAFSAPPELVVGEDDYRKFDDSNFYCPPEMTHTKGHAAIADDKRRAWNAVKILYSNKNSPLHHGFNKSHADFIKYHLECSESKSILDDLLQLIPKFSKDIYSYINAKTPWTNSAVLKSCGSLPLKGKFLPVDGDNIPDYNVNENITTSKTLPIEDCLSKFGDKISAVLQTKNLNEHSNATSSVTSNRSGVESFIYSYDDLTEFCKAASLDSEDIDIVLKTTNVVVLDRLCIACKKSTDNELEQSQLLSKYIKGISDLAAFCIISESNYKKGSKQANEV